MEMFSDMLYLYWRENIIEQIWSSCGGKAQVAYWAGVVQEVLASGFQQ